MILLSFFNESCRKNVELYRFSRLLTEPMHYEILISTFNVIPYPDLLKVTWNIYVLTLSIIGYLWTNWKMKIREKEIEWVNYRVIKLLKYISINVALNTSKMLVICISLNVAFYTKRVARTYYRLLAKQNIAIFNTAKHV